MEETQGNSHWSSKRYPVGNLKECPLKRRQNSMRNWKSCRDSEAINGGTVEYVLEKLRKKS